MKVRPISGASVDARAGRRRGRAGALFAGAVLLAVTACGGGGAGPGAGSGDGKDKDRGGDAASAVSGPSEAVVAIAPKNGAGSVDTSGALKVTARKGKLTEVEVEGPGGARIAGKISGDGATWTPSSPLATATEYQVRAVAADADGRTATEKSRFTTLTPESTFLGRFTPEDGSKVGVGMPFSIRFDRGITDPAAVEKAIEIRTEPPVEVEGHWFGDDRLDFRPETYWKSGTEVTVRLALDGVEGRPGVYGEQSKTISFTIGRNQVSVVDAEKLTMKVMRDGEVVRTIPITTGAPGYETWNGRMVISEKHTETRMDGATVGYEGEYDIPDVPHAMRLSDSGTFIHGNYWGGDAFGNRNVSHGCIGLRDVKGAWDEKAPGAWFFAHSLLGDVVEVKNSDDATIAPENGLNGWNMSWEKWKA
ncbi:Ig-like domain-containing protein [Streptomyces sp. NPDC091377]|uniref:L,D-transpeptidase n=1 Tax=Streptomyces sp. NPDC091377 TaxID=3365995 RepID=UPI0037FCEE0B